MKTRLAWFLEGFCKFWLLISGQALCTTAAVIGGKTLASQISEKV
ncbi:hypothetical protein A2U01_0061096, partial [Trifolium medium]|nr:hypothetical protein [Trifolium medium]